MSKERSRACRLFTSRLCTIVHRADAAAARRDGTPFVDASNRCPATLKRERAEEEAFAAVEDEDEDEEGEEEEEAAAGAGAATAAAAAKGAGATEGSGSAVLLEPCTRCE